MTEISDVPERRPAPSEFFRAVVTGIGATGHL